MPHDKEKGKPVLVLPAPHLPGTACVIVPEPVLDGTPLMGTFDIAPGVNAVATLLIRGMPPEKCSLHLVVSITTIRPHLRALFRKTNTRN